MEPSRSTGELHLLRTPYGVPFSYKLTAARVAEARLVPGLLGEVCLGEHSKRKVAESDGLLGAYELADRVCRVFGCLHYEHLSIP